jgi:hypothetical protein
MARERPLRDSPQFVSFCLMLAVLAGIMYGSVVRPAFAAERSFRSVRQECLPACAGVIDVPAKYDGRQVTDLYALADSERNRLVLIMEFANGAGRQAVFRRSDIDAKFRSVAGVRLLHVRFQSEGGSTRRVVVDAQ